MMKQIYLYIFFLLFPLGIQADLLTDILGKKYDAQELSVSELDSLLNGQATLTSDEMYLPQHRYVLGYENKQKMFRRSFEANYFLTDKRKNERIAIGDTLVRDAYMSPNGQYVVYGKGQDLYIYKTLYGTEVAVTEDGDNVAYSLEDGSRAAYSLETASDVFNGVSDWLYEEEFGVTRLFAFSPDSKLVAFVRLDEQDVPTFSWQTYRDKQYPMKQSLRYPKAGGKNAQASVCVYDISNKGIRTIQLPPMEDAYIPRLQWRQVGDNCELLIERLNRDQNQMEIFAANPKTTLSTLLYSEKSDRYYVDYALFDEWKWLSDGRFVVLSEKEGYRQLYLYSSQGYEQKKLTTTAIDVTTVYGVDEKTGFVYYQAAPTPATRQAYAVSLKNGKVCALTEGEGKHDLTFAKDMKQVIDCYQSVTCANQYTLYKVKSDRLESIRLVKDNREIETAWQATQLPNKQFIRIPTERGDSLDAWIILPNEIKTAGADGVRTKYPVVMMQYSGPASQRVLNQWRHRFGHYLAGQGYIVVNADPRGTDCRGRAWRNATYMNLGQKEAEDQLSVAKYMQSLPYVDGERIAMIGWSYGGFQTIRTMCEQTEPIIKCGIAIAPVTDWRLYDTGYTERFMRRVQVNEDGYQAADLTQMADHLQGRLLLVHATGDDNVHFQNTLLLSDALVRAGKDFDTQLYVDDNHSLLDKANKEHLHRKIMTYLKANL